MSALSAPNGLATLQRHILVAVAALVVHGARVEVDLLRGFGGVGVVAAVLLGRHIWGICVGGMREGERATKRRVRVESWLWSWLWEAQEVGCVEKL